MKKICFALVLALALSTCSSAILNHSSNYPRTAVVTSVNYFTDEVTLTDFVGHDWVIFGADDWCVGDYCSMIMNDRGTREIFDDEIVSMQYNGWLDGSWGWDGEREILDKRTSY